MDKTIYEMKFNEILGLNKSYKMQAIQLLIESMIDDRVQDIIAFYETELCECELFNKYAEAIRDIKLSIQPVSGGILLETAIEALEKQIPYRVDEKYAAINGLTYGNCKCGEVYAQYNKYCNACGQRLDWD